MNVKQLRILQKEQSYLNSFDSIEAADRIDSYLQKNNLFLDVTIEEFEKWLELILISNIKPQGFEFKILKNDTRKYFFIEIDKKTRIFRIVRYGCNSWRLEEVFPDENGSIAYGWTNIWSVGHPEGGDSFKFEVIGDRVITF
jgi:hypothetical protein